MNYLCASLLLIVVFVQMTLLKCSSNLHHLYDRCHCPWRKLLLLIINHLLLHCALSKIKILLMAGCQINNHVVHIGVRLFECWGCERSQGQSKSSICVISLIMKEDALRFFFGWTQMQDRGHRCGSLENVFWCRELRGGERFLHKSSDTKESIWVLYREITHVKRELQKSTKRSREHKKQTWEKKRRRKLDLVKKKQL